MIPLLTPFRLPANAPLSAVGVSRFGSKAAPAYVAATSSASFAALISRAVLRALRRNGSSVSFDRVIIAPKISRWRPKCTAAPTAQCDRTRLRQWSPPKREFLRLGLETFRRFPPKLRILGSLETGVIRENPCKMQAFRVKIDHNLRSSEWLAGAGGIEPPNGGIKISLIFQRFQDPFGKNGRKTLQRFQ
jgi:hypothetical protein